MDGSRVTEDDLRRRVADEQHRHAGAGQRAMVAS